MLVKGYCDTFDTFPVAQEVIDQALQKCYLESELMAKLVSEQPLLIRMFTKEQVMANRTLVNQVKYLIIDLCDLRAARIAHALGLDLNMEISDFAFDLDDEDDVIKKI